MPTTTDNQTREEALEGRMHEIEAKYTEDGIVVLGNATPEELRELGKLNRELTELRKPQPEEISA
jgi:hypothetical protein